MRPSLFAVAGPHKHSESSEPACAPPGKIDLPSSGPYFVRRSSLPSSSCHEHVSSSQAILLFSDVAEQPALAMTFQIQAQARVSRSLRADRWSVGMNALANSLDISNVPRIAAYRQTGLLPTPELSTACRLISNARLNQIDARAGNRMP